MALAIWTAANTAQLDGRARVDPYATIRADLATTTSYVASSHVATTGFRRVAVLIKVTWVDSTSTEWYVEWSMDGTTWYRSINVSPSAGTNTITVNSQTHVSAASVNLTDSFDVEAPFMRVNIKKTGGVGADTAEIIAVALAL